MFMPRVVSSGAVRLFLKARAARWQAENVAFNPQEQWRIRPRRASTCQKNFFGLDATSLLRLNNGSVSSLVTQTTPSWFFCSPSVNSQNLASTHLPTRRSLSWLELIFYSPARRAVMKLKYKGKSFRWHRRRRALILRFGHSHLVTRTPLPWTKSRKHGRMKIIFWGTNAWYLRKFLQATIKWRPMNIYHGRGLRLLRQKVPRKAGKVSAYR